MSAQAQLKKSPSSTPNMEIMVDEGKRPRWITGGASKTIVKIISEALFKAGVTGNIQISYMTLKNVRMMKNKGVCTMTLNLGVGNLPATIGAIVVGEDPGDICTVQVHMSPDSRVLLLGYFQSLPEQIFRFYPDPTILPHPSSGKDKEMKAPGSDQSKSKNPMLDRDTIALFLIGFKEELQEHDGGFMTKGRATALMKGLCSGDGTFESALVEEIINLGYLTEDNSGKVPLVEISTTGHDLVEESTRAPEPPPVQVITIPSTTTVSPSALRFDELKAEISKVREELKVVQRQNAEAEKAMAPLKTEVSAANAQKEDAKAKAAMHEQKVAEFHKKEAEARKKVLDLEAQIRKHQEKVSTTTAGLEVKLKDLLEERRKLLED